MQSKKVILDTNLWISFLISGNFDAIDKLIDSGKIVLIFSEESIEEFLTVVNRKKFKKYFSAVQIRELLNMFDKYGKLVKVKTDVHLCKDHKDDFLLNLAIDSKSDYLVTGDSDLLEIKEIKKTRIVTFLTLIDEIK